jgi:hypothetical protein
VFIDKLLFFNFTFLIYQNSVLDCNAAVPGSNTAPPQITTNSDSS